MGEIIRWQRFFILEGGAIVISFSVLFGIEIAFQSIFLLASIFTFLIVMMRFWHMLPGISSFMFGVLGALSFSQLILFSAHQFPLFVIPLVLLLGLTWMISIVAKLISGYMPIDAKKLFWHMFCEAFIVWVLFYVLSTLFGIAFSLPKFHEPVYMV